MARYLTNGDKILQAVLSDQRLSEYADYEVGDFETISKALESDNPVVCTVAKIIFRKESKLSEKEIYNEVSNFLMQNI